MNRIFSILAAGALLAGCTTTSPNSPKAQARAKSAQLHEGMSQGQVERIFGHPGKVEQNDGYHHHDAYIPYYGWHHSGSGEPEMKWEYKNLDLEVKFRRSGSGWVVKEWDQG